MRADFFSLVEEQQRQERNKGLQPHREGGEDSANLDFMLALSLQSEGQPSSLAEQDFWRAVCEADQPHGTAHSRSDIKGMFAYSVVAFTA